MELLAGGLFGASSQTETEGQSETETDKQRQDSPLSVSLSISESVGIPASGRPEHHRCHVDLESTFVLVAVGVPFLGLSSCRSSRNTRR